MLDIETLVGMEEKPAEDLITQASFTFRIMKEEGNDMMGTMDVRDDRVNLEVQDGKITKAYIG